MQSQIIIKDPASFQKHFIYCVFHYKYNNEEQGLISFNKPLNRKKKV